VGLGRVIPCHFTIHLRSRSIRSPNSRINEIRGILVDEEEIKVTLFADDMTCFLSYIASYHRSVATLQFFSRFSNLHVNKEKTEIFATGRHCLDQINYPHKIRTSIKVL